MKKPQLITSFTPLKYKIFKNSQITNTSLIQYVPRLDFSICYFTNDKMLTPVVLKLLSEWVEDNF